jgi:hypothetical protein
MRLAVMLGVALLTGCSAMEGDPGRALVGTWIVDGPTETRERAWIFRHDGTIGGNNNPGSVGVTTWDATRANLTIHNPSDVAWCPDGSAVWTWTIEGEVLTLEPTDGGSCKGSSWTFHRRMAAETREKLLGTWVSFSQSASNPVTMTLADDASFTWSPGAISGTWEATASRMTLRFSEDGLFCAGGSLVWEFELAGHRLVADVVDGDCGADPVDTGAPSPDWIFDRQVAAQ